MKHTASIIALLLAFIVITGKAQEQKGSAPAQREIQSHLQHGDIHTALRVLSVAQEWHPQDPQLAYLRGVALERQALASLSHPASEFDLFFGKPMAIRNSLTPSTDMFAKLITKPAHMWNEPPTGGEQQSSPCGHLIDWCTPEDEKYPEKVYRMCKHLNLIRWGPLNSRKKQIIVPCDLETIRQYAFARLAIHAVYMDSSAKSALAEKLTKAGIDDAKLLLDLSPKSDRDGSFWQEFEPKAFTQNWRTVLWTIASLRRGTPANRVVPAYNCIAEKYPLLARLLIKWADVRKARYDRKMLRKVVPAGPVKIRLHGNKDVTVNSKFEVVRETKPQSVVFRGRTTNDGSFVVPRKLLSEPCIVKLNGNRVGRITSNDHILANFEIHKLLGNPAPDCELSSLKQDRTVKLSSFKGKVVYIDFWATWCGPCQRPMAKLEHLAKKMPQEWRDHVCLIGVSIDRERSQLEAHLKQRNWSNVQQFWAGTNARKVQKQFGVTGVPTAFLLDQEGRVIWTGHPDDIDVEKEISAQLRKGATSDAPK